MKCKYGVFVIVALLFVSCAATKDNLNVTESYSLISSSFQLTKDAHKEINERYLAALHALSNNQNAVVDIKGLNSLLDSAKSANQKSSAMLDLAGEINSTKYKETASKYINLLDKLYNNEYRKYIVVLSGQTEGKLERAEKLLQSRQVELERLDKKFLLAANEVHEKYQLQITDSSKMSK